MNRVDNMIIQAIALMDTLDKDVNTFVMRVREWYGWHFPELMKIVTDSLANCDSPADVGCWNPITSVPSRRLEARSRALPCLAKHTASRDSVPLALA